MPADKFQTKNGGKNHGRWFYTCQKAQPKRCQFFLWSDEAKIREESAVLSNSRTEPDAQHALQPQPQTPQKAVAATMHQPITPDTLSRAKAHYTTPSKAVDIMNEESFEWPSSADEELAEAADSLVDEPPARLPVCETPRKAARTETYSSPGKRSQSEMLVAGTATSAWPLTIASDDVFATPSTSNKSHGLLSPVNTPALSRSQADAILPPPEPSTLAAEVLRILESLHIPSNLESDLIELLNRHDLRTQGIAKGREIARLAIQGKEKRITELQARIAALEGERETSRTVIKVLKSDIATSPTKQGGRGRGASFGKKSEV